MKTLNEFIKSKEEVKCRNCFDKGFFSIYQGGVYLTPDFHFDKEMCLKPQGIEIKYCSCKKGKRLNNNK